MKHYKEQKLLFVDIFKENFSNFEAVWGTKLDIKQHKTMKVN
jgi:hypothetical protein